MLSEQSLLSREQRELITERLSPFAIGWLGAMTIWLAVFASEGRVTPLAALMFGVQAVVLAVTVWWCRADPMAGRVLPVALAGCVLLGLASTVLVVAAHSYGEILAFMLLTLYLAAALLFSWGWRAELTLLLATLVPWALVLDRFDFFVRPLEIAAAVTIGASLALAIAEGAARSFRSVLRRRRSLEQVACELEASRDAYRDLAENARDMIWSSDPAGRLTYVNEATARFVDMPPSAILGHRIADFATADPRNSDLDDIIQRLTAGETLPPFLIETHTPRGPRWIEVLSSAVRDADDVLTGFRGISRDVTERQAAAEQLRASEARYRGLVESQHELVVRMDLDGRVTFANEAYLTKFGKHRGDVIGRTFFDLIHPDDREMVATAGRALERPPRRTLIEARNFTADGMRWVSWEGSVVLDDGGRPVELQAVGRDVTERRAAEEALRASEARYRGLVESACELVTRFDREGCLTFVNDSYCQALGQRRDDIVGRNPMFLVHPADQAETLAAWGAATHPPYRGRTETRGLTPQGWRWFEWEVSGVLDAGEQVVEIQQVGRDVTARRQAEADLRESEERFRSAFDDAAIGMGVTTIDGRALRVNPALCEMLGYAEHELLGRTMNTIVHPADRDLLNLDRTRLAAGEARSYRAERRYVRSDGRVLWVHATASVVCDVSGAPLYLIGQLQDVTERRLAEEALRGSLQELRSSEENLRLLAQRQVAIREEERKRLGFDLHDDVCQELVGVGILVESLRHKLAPMPAEQAAEFDRVVAYLGEVVEHLRLLARELRPLLLRDLGLDGGLRSLADGMTTAGVSVVTDFRAPIPRLHEETEVTVYRIAQEALANVTRHAAAHRIVIGLAIETGWLRLEVRDDGRGFDPAVRPAAALGLASMEERAIALGGRLDIQSVRAKGTTVVLSCPIGTPPAGQLMEPAVPSPTRSSSRLSAAPTSRSAARD